MRMTDRLLTETPRPALNDVPFTKFADMIPNPVAIDATDVHALFMEMTAFEADGSVSVLDLNNPIARALASKFGEDTGWQIAQFFEFDWRSIGTIAPPFDEFVIEVDVRESMAKAAKAHGIAMNARDLAEVGQHALACTVFTRDRWNDGIMMGLADRGGPSEAVNYLSGLDLDDISSLPFRWMMMASTFRYVPGEGLHGPLSTWMIPIDQDGSLFIDPEDHTLIHAVAIGPRCPKDRTRSQEYVLTQGFQVLIPALFALSFMNTPVKTRTRDGYHSLEEQEPPTGRLARKYLERNFRPMTTWKVLNIDPLREAIREAHGGRMPTDLGALRKALHIVRGHTATYMPNTYFGQKHDAPITVFRPSYKRGDARSGVVQKEYHLATTGSD